MGKKVDTNDIIGELAKLQKVENIIANQLKLQALLAVMDIATENVPHGRRNLIYWSGVYALAGDLVEKTLVDAGELENHFGK